MFRPHPPSPQALMITPNLLGKSIQMLGMNEFQNYSCTLL
jgi:hypothetical protein